MNDCEVYLQTSEAGDTARAVLALQTQDEQTLNIDYVMFYTNECPEMSLTTDPELYLNDRNVDALEGNGGYVLFNVLFQRSDETTFPCTVDLEVAAGFYSYSVSLVAEDLSSNRE